MCRSRISGTEKSWTLGRFCREAVFAISQTASVFMRGFETAVVSYANLWMTFIFGADLCFDDSRRLANEVGFEASCPH